MTKQFAILLLTLLPVCCFSQSKLLVIKNVAVVDVIRNRIVANRFVVIEGNRIVSTGDGARISPGATVLDAKGKYLMPGLWDMHTHSLRKARLPVFLPLFIANGVTGIRDMASDMSLADISLLRDEIEVGKTIGPRLGCFTGKILDGPTQPDTLLFTYPSNADAARQIIQTYKKQGGCFIKVYNMLSREMYFAIAEECKRNNIPFAGHVPFAVTAAEASNAGQHSIEHLSDLLISVSTSESQLRANLSGSRSDNAIQSSKKRMEVNFDASVNYSEAKAATLFATFTRNKTWQCPTLINLQITSTHANLSLQMADPRFKYFPNTLKDAWKRSLLSRLTGDSLQRKRFFSQSLLLVFEMQKAGVQLLAGTDLSSSFQMPGFSLHDELQLMVDAGLTPAEALQTATTNPARFLHLENDLGSVEKGKIADLVLLDANPLQSISNVKKINAVVVNGKLFQRSDLDALLMQVEVIVQQLNTKQ